MDKNGGAFAPPNTLVKEEIMLERKLFIFKTVLI